MSVVTDVVAVSNNRRTIEKVAELLDEFYQRRYEGAEFGSADAILDYDHPDYDDIQVGPRVGGAEILWFTLNHQSYSEFIDILKGNGVKGVTLWIDAEYNDGPEVVTL